MVIETRQTKRGHEPVKGVHRPCPVCTETLTFDGDFWVGHRLDCSELPGRPDSEGVPPEVQEAIEQTADAGVKAVAEHVRKVSAGQGYPLFMELEADPQPTKPREEYRAMEWESRTDGGPEESELTELVNRAEHECNANAEEGWRVHTWTITSYDSDRVQGRVDVLMVREVAPK